mmetsp:Transcript_177838/g.570342  ORF Transcript_177838/g.570342 Transcript_177838/m.570342 type:complete len:335 (+) Transcript_177838:4473-5477(+)
MIHRPARLQRERIHDQREEELHHGLVVGRRQVEGRVGQAAGLLEALTANADVVASQHLANEDADVPRPSPSVDHARRQPPTKHLQRCPGGAFGVGLAGLLQWLKRVHQIFGHKPVCGLPQECPLAVLGVVVHFDRLPPIHRQAHGARHDVEQGAETLLRKDWLGTSGLAAGPAHLCRPGRHNGPHQGVARVRVLGEEVPPAEQAPVLDKLLAALRGQGHEHEAGEQDEGLLARIQELLQGAQDLLGLPLVGPMSELVDHASKGLGEVLGTGGRLHRSTSAGALELAQHDGLHGAPIQSLPQPLQGTLEGCGLSGQWLKPPAGQALFPQPSEALL